jgi:tripartite-type tricarboxylate transporter receptor subunit TctC
MKKFTLITAIFIILALSIGSLSAGCAAGEFPSRSVEMVCGWGVGGGSDTVNRKEAQIWSKYVDVPIHVVNVSGHSGTVAMERIVSAPADGYTVGPYATGMLTVLAIEQPIDMDDIMFLCGLQTTPSYLFVPYDSSYQTIEDVINDAKNNEMTVASSGAYGVDQLHTDFINMERGTKFTIVPFKEPTERYTAMQGGHTDLMVEQLGDVKSYVEDKKIRPVVIFAPDRSKNAPDVPSSWVYDLPISVPMVRGHTLKAGTPDSVVKKLDKIFQDIYNDPEFQQFNAGMNIEEDCYMDHKEFTKFAEEQTTLIQQIAKTLQWPEP